MGYLNLILTGAMLLARSIFFGEYPDSVRKVAFMKTVDQIINFYGYPSENFTVKTSDGYYLTLNRIPNPGRPPILLMHDFSGSAANFVMMGPWSDLAYLLHDKGYDVWLGNSRGSRFSRSHEKFNPNLSKQFWNYSWHEIGIYDLPAMITFILRTTKHEKLSYIGFSEGAKEFFVMSSLLPEYNKNIQIMHAIAASVYTSYVKSSIRNLAEGLIEKQTPPYLGEFKLQIDRTRELCLRKNWGDETCKDFLNGIFGTNMKYFNKTMLPVMLNHFATGSSMRSLMHTFETAKTRIFAPFDVKFFTEHPQPQTPYPLENVKVPVALYYCQNDYLISVKDAQRLARELPNVVDDYLVPVPEWNHMDPIIASNAREKLYHHILDIQEKYYNEPTTIEPTTIKPTTEENAFSSFEVLEQL